MTSCVEGEIQFADVNGAGFCIASGCTTDADCGEGGGLCTFDEQQGVNLCLQVCETETDCADGRVCVEAGEALSLCAFR